MRRVARPTSTGGFFGLCPCEERLVYRFFAGNHASEVSHLQFNASQVVRLFVARWMLKRLLHPVIVSGEKPVECLFGEAGAFIRVCEVLMSDAVVVDSCEDVSINNNRSEFLHEIRC